MGAHPWYISFTAIWQEAEGFDRLRTVCNELRDDISFHHLPVKEDYWHFTVLPLLSARKWPAFTPAESLMFSLFKNIDNSLSLDGIDLPQLIVQAYEVVSFNSGTCIQFWGINNCLSKLRGKLRELAKAEIERLVTSHDGLVSKLDPPTLKNTGNKSYGSIARALTPEDNSIRWQRKIDPLATLCFRSIYILVSDEYLSNPYAHDDNRRRKIALQGQ